MIVWSKPIVELIIIPTGYHEQFVIRGCRVHIGTHACLVVKIGIQAKLGS